MHICEATLTKRLNEFVDTEAGSLNVSSGYMYMCIDTV